MNHRPRPPSHYAASFPGLILPTSLLSFLVLPMLTACAAPSPARPNAPAHEASASSHATGLVPAEADEPTSMVAQAPDAWAQILQSYTTADGGFRYAELHADAEDRDLLTDEVERIASASLDDMSAEARLAFLINAYNTLTVASVIELWPVESVMSEEGFFDTRTHVVAGSSMTLNTLENEHIRGMGEPRIHFAVNCASAGCPPLARTPYSASSLDSMLTAQTRAFVRATTSVDAESSTASLSQIFEWFAGDFEAAGGVRAFVAGYLDAPDAAVIVAETTTLSFVPYDWALNGR